MKPMTAGEVHVLAEELRSIVGSRIQSVSSNETSLGLGFHSMGKMVWLWIDLRPSCPVALLFLEDPPKHKKKVKPVALFLNAHLKNRFLTEVVHAEDFGRVLRLHVSSDDFVEIRLFPHGENILVHANERSIAWNKPKDLEKLGAADSEQEGRSLGEIRRQWETQKKTPASGGGGRAASGIERSLEKKQLALQKMRSDVEEKKMSPWRAVGEWLKTEQTMGVPPAWEKYIDRTLGLAGNIEHCFEKARQTEGKTLNAEKRIEALVGEVEKIKRGELPQIRDEEERAAPPAGTGEVQARKKELENGMIAWLGKSAADNLNLLRGAQSWDYWVHLKDFPGAHAVIRRGRKQDVSDRVLIEIGRWCVAQSPASRRALEPGDAVEILVAECRYVRPIKGDRLGRVNYTNERVLRFRL